MIWHRSLAGGGHSVLGFDPATAETPSRAASTCRLRGSRRHVPDAYGGRSWSPTRTVHPRVCGEQHAMIQHTPQPSGSSPRVRGTVAEPQGVHCGRRFIPACAGNRESIRFRVPGSTVHPRVCGEQSVAELVVCAPTGSSPRVRGTDPYHFRILVDQRFIPACAGNRTATRIERSSSPVHPRVCGEQFAPPLSRRHLAGSSPRVRGTVESLHRVVPDDRFIPACAGNRSRRRNRRWTIPVHPRVCGEQNFRAFTREIRIGSSPRVRGTVQGPAGGPLGQRFIPACAGNR